MSDASECGERADRVIGRTEAVTDKLGDRSGARARPVAAGGHAGVAR